MSNAVAMNQTQPVDAASLQQVLLGGNLSVLNSAQKIAYYNKVCELVGLNPLTKPFDYLVLNGKEVLYANKGCAEQLRSVHKISIRITSREKIDDVYVITAEASNDVGRVDSSTGAINLAGLKGENLANAMMKCETKAKRRVTLSICGLNMLDETEVDSIRQEQYTPTGAVAAAVAPQQPEITDGTNTSSRYIIAGGQWVKRSLPEVMRGKGPDAIKKYIVYLEETAAKRGAPLNGWAKEFVEEASFYMADYENGNLDPKTGEYLDEAGEIVP